VVNNSTGKQTQQSAVVFKQDYGTSYMFLLNMYTYKSFMREDGVTDDADGMSADDSVLTTMHTVTDTTNVHTAR